MKKKTKKNAENKLYIFFSNVRKQTEICKYYVLSFGSSDWPDLFFVTTGASLDDFMHKVGLFN